MYTYSFPWWLTWKLILRRMYKFPLQLCRCYDVVPVDTQHATFHIPDTEGLVNAGKFEECARLHNVQGRCKIAPDSNFHVAHMGPTWVLSAPGESHVGPMNLAIRGHLELKTMRPLSLDGWYSGGLKAASTKNSGIDTIWFFVQFNEFNVLMWSIDQTMK